MPRFWIHHPARDCPVSFARWAVWHISQAIIGCGIWLEYKALHSDQDKDELPF